MAAPAGFAWCSTGKAGMFCSRGDRGRLAAYHPEDSEKGDYSDSDSEKIKVFPIHNAARFVAPQARCFKSRI